ncbi:metal ABC transporter substrate-binding protein [Nocardioides marmoribigeumensis]|uniref:Zinc transport system substrate-binding protein n=1 Tax=Nocardioides marmoribigeumensis TaxID=433649 RepID=A0ABU2BQE1_9ACTN|nr:metal ABC transporter substrate-binding protein [Nocardioides marmoribigeumensis]MDR7360862.1 zinc transport system substrate-binding protein [Nocardioides marmoribigeumensis]
MRFLAPVLAAGLLLPTLTACSNGDGSSGDLEVVASFYPLQYVAQRVAGDHATVESLTAPGKEPHDSELTVRQTADVARADVVVTLGGFQPSVDDAVDQEADGAVVDAHEEVRGDDPHFWQDPTRLAAVAQRVGSALAKADAAHAADYRRNAQELVGDLRALDRAYRSGLADCRVDTVVVSHDAFGYLDRYGLDVVGITGLSPDAEPSPARLRDLADLIRRTGVTTVFSETLVSPAVARTLAEEVGVRTATLDPVEGLTDETADLDYLSLMRRNLEALRTAGSCT